MIHIKGKGIIDSTGRKVMSKRQMDLTLARTYGAKGDSASFTRLLIESRIAVAILSAEYRKGKMLV